MKELLYGFGFVVSCMLVAFAALTALITVIVSSVKTAEWILGFLP